MPLNTFAWLAQISTRQEEEERKEENADTAAGFLKCIMKKCCTHQIKAGDYIGQNTKFQRFLINFENLVSVVFT